MGHERVVQEFELAAQQGIGAGVTRDRVACRAHGREGLRVGEERAAGQLGGDAALVGRG